MFRDLLAADPSRFFDSAGKQIPGLFEVNADTDSRGSWGFVQNDKIEIAVQMKFLNPVTRRGTDNTEEDSETVVIAAGSVFKIRLQIVATDTPSGAAAKQEVAKTELAMTIAEQAAATAKAAANAAAAQRTAAQAVAAAAAQTTAAQDRYTRAVDTNKKQAAAAARLAGTTRRRVHRRHSRSASG
jgi:cytoskeletal protein RodZ